MDIKQQIYANSSRGLLILAVFFLCGFLASAQDGYLSPVNGTWKKSGSEEYLIFFQDATYLWVNVLPSGSPTFERGAFRWEGGYSIGKLIATARVGTDGTYGFSHQPEADVEISRYSADKRLNFKPSVQGGISGEYAQTAFNRMFDNGGTYFSDDGRNSILLVIDSLTRIVIHEDSTDVNSHAGVDYKGNYGQKNPPVITRFKSNGNLSNKPESLTFPDIDTAILTEGTTVRTFRRTSFIGSAHPNRIDANLTKISSHSQRAAASTSPVAFSKFADTSPYTWSITVRGENIPAIPVLTLGFVNVGLVRGFELEPNPGSVESYCYTGRFFSLEELESPENFPKNAYFNISMGGTSFATFSPESGIQFPPIPQITGEGSWKSGVFEPATALIRWSPHTGVSPANSRTILTIRNPDQPGTNLHEISLPTATTSMDLSRLLTPGKTYPCKLTHVTDSQRSSGYFSSSHHSHRTETSFSVRLTSTPPVPSPPFTLPVSFSRLPAGNAYLFVKGDGFPGATYQWFLDGVPMPGQTASSVEIKSNSPDADAYHVVVTDSLSRVRSNNSYLGITAPIGAKAEQFVIGKDVRYRQTGSTDVALDTANHPDELAGAYGFSAILSGSNLRSISPPTITPPGVRKPAFASSMFFDDDDITWNYGLKGVNSRTNSKADFDSIFPVGRYILGSSAANLFVDLPAAIFPITPVAKLSGGTWINGKYAMARNARLSVVTNEFTGFRTGSTGLILLEYGEKEIEQFSTGNSGPGIVSLNTTADDRANKLTIGFANYYGATLSPSGLASAALYATSTVTEIHVLPHIAAHPLGATLRAGYPHTLSVIAGGTRASGSDTLTYRWTKNGVLLDGETSPILKIKRARRHQSGTYLCTVSNDVGSATSTPAHVTVLPDPYESYLDTFSTTPEELGADHADSDGDGTSNLLEFVLNSDPTNPSNANPPPFVWEQNVLKFSYLRPVESSAIQLDVEYTDVLGNPWKLSIEGIGKVTKTLVGLGNGMERVVISIPFDSPAGFARLRAIRH